VELRIGQPSSKILTLKFQALARPKLLIAYWKPANVHLKKSVSQEILSFSVHSFWEVTHEPLHLLGALINAHYRASLVSPDLRGFCRDHHCGDRHGASQKNHQQDGMWQFRVPALAGVTAANAG
jgi:hypothetical protein